MTLETDTQISQERFGNYQLVRQLGRGMADVYLAHDPGRECPVVLKIIARSNRLSIEAEARGARLQQELHQRDPRILDVFQVGEQGGYFYVAMEYAAGQSLAKLIAAERTLDPLRAARHAAEICDQLRVLHEFVSDTGVRTPIVHGDIKPSNIQIAEGDRVRLLDFGIAKRISPGHDLTQHALGSPSYCSPERLRESRVNLQADLWALGVTLYEMLAGSPPFQAQSTRKLEVLIQSHHPLNPLPDDCPADLKAIVCKALQRDSSRRYSTARAFESDLRAFLEGRPVSATVERSTTSRRSGATIIRLRRRTAPLNSRHPDRPKHDRANMVIALLAGILAGLLLFIPLTYYFKLRDLSQTLTARKDYVQADPAVLESDWRLYQLFKNGHAWWSGFFPAGDLEDSLRSNLFVSADNLISRFRRSSVQDVKEADWAQARLCLMRSLSIDPGDSKAFGELHLCDGYLRLSRDASKKDVLASLQSFRQAEASMPRSADPHLALARADIYGLHNVGAALAEFQAAQQLGYRLGPREWEQEADGYFFRGHADLARAKTSAADAPKRLRLANADLERARRLYEPIDGFDRVTASLQKVDTDLADSQSLQNAQLRAASSFALRLVWTKTRTSRRAGGSRGRWSK